MELALGVYRGYYNGKQHGQLEHPQHRVTVYPPEGRNNLSTECTLAGFNHQNKAIHVKPEYAIPQNPYLSYPKP